MRQIFHAAIQVIGVFLCLLVFLPQVQATHNRAGEITYRQLGPLTIEATITTYTKASSSQADRDSLTIFWGDGHSETIPRINNSGQGEVLGNDIKKNIYRGIHDYPGRATYRISMQDPNRIAEIQNINWPNSISVKFFLQTTLTLYNVQNQGFNNSVQLLQAPIDEGCIGRRFMHNPGAFDVDGDSIAYELITPFEAENSVVPNYQLPDQIRPGPNNQISINPLTGDVIWDAPQLVGEYNIAILIKEYRDGFLVNSIVRDMQIRINNCTDRPPDIFTRMKYCMIAGDALQDTVHVNDPDLGDLLQVSASGGPFELTPSPAQFNSSPYFTAGPLAHIFSWQTVCEHIHPKPYQVLFKASDDEFINTPDTNGLVAFKQVDISVLGPPPLIEEITSNTTGLQIKWAIDYDCATSSHFHGYTIWRKSGPSTIQGLDSCGMDLANYGFFPIAFNQLDTMNGQYFFQDNTVDPNQVYCYRVTAEFGTRAPSGNIYNQVQSLPSEELCAILARDLPMLTHVDVEQTSATNGRIRIAWVPALAPDFDTTIYLPPYKLELCRLDQNNSEFNVLPSATITANSFAQLWDNLMFTDAPISTLVEQQYVLKIYYKGDSLYGQCPAASSILLMGNISNQRVDLFWDEQVPWTNQVYTIFETDIDGTIIDSLGQTNNQRFADSALINGSTYCYKVRAKGTYGIFIGVDSLINYSQFICLSPRDTVPPCTVELSGQGPCDQADIDSLDDQFVLLNINHDPSCMDQDIVSQYIYIYHSPSDSVLIYEGPAQSTFELELDSLRSLCIKVFNEDLSGNLSDASNPYCIEICPAIDFPNTFTPNGDQANEFFLPRSIRFISDLSIKIYTRWDNLVYSSEDINFAWDGTDPSGAALPSDVYYYVCDIYTQAADGNQVLFDQVEGFIQLIKE